MSVVTNQIKIRISEPLNESGSVVASGELPTDSSARLAIDLVSDIAAFACEYESQLNLMSLANYLDLYRCYLAGCGAAWPGNSFERFVRDPELLAHAAAEAARESGSAVAVPKAL